MLPARGTIEHYFKPVSVKQMVPRIDNNKCRETSVSVDDKSSISCSDSASQAASSVWSCEGATGCLSLPLVDMDMQRQTELWLQSFDLLPDSGKNVCSCSCHSAAGYDMVICHLPVTDVCFDCPCYENL